MEVITILTQIIDKIPQQSSKNGKYTYPSKNKNVDKNKPETDLSLKGVLSDSKFSDMLSNLLFIFFQYFKDTFTSH